MTGGYEGCGDSLPSADGHWLPINTDAERLLRQLRLFLSSALGMTIFVKYRSSTKPILWRV
jgi:hypothetical protein